MMAAQKDTSFWKENIHVENNYWYELDFKGDELRRNWPHQARRVKKNSPIRLVIKKTDCTHRAEGRAKCAAGGRSGRGIV